MGFKVVCLCSGGLDSTTAASIAKKEGGEIHLFHILYGQKAEQRELMAIEKISQFFNAEVKVVRTDLFQNISPLTTAQASIPVGDKVDLDDYSTPSTWVYCRNLVFGSMAAAYAESIGAEKITLDLTLRRPNLIRTTGQSSLTGSIIY